MKYKIYGCFLCLLDIFIVGFAFFLVAWHRAGTRIIIRNYSRPLIGFTIIWIVVSILGCKYDFKPPKKLINVIICVMRDNIMALAIVFVAMYFFQLFFYSRLIVFGTIILTTILELIIFTLVYYTFRFYKDTDIDERGVFITQSDKLRTGTFYTNNGSNLAEVLPYVPPFGEDVVADTVMLKLWRNYLNKCSELFNFINDTVSLTSFSDRASMVLKSSTIFNIEHFDPGSQQLFINLHPVNDFRRVNRYFIKVNENLAEGGVFICCGETIGQRYNRFKRSFGKLFGNIFYFFDFIYRRILPKIPLTQGLYFALSQGKNRSLPETEILGRLYFCGFKLLGYKDIDGMMYFIVKKIKEPSQDINPSYGPIIKLRRVGLNGKIFFCYKLRTMHPYSEYLQEYIHTLHSVSNSGKFANDFRITDWGRFFRRYWIDELPQFINLFRGDLRIIGTRALSVHFFEQYPNDIKEMRLKIKPGLIPVYTADKVTNLPDLLVSERKYLERHMKKPFTTDCVYLCKALFNILTRRVKSLDCYQ
ncbi:MAG: sugar transferase [Candidatus Cloacimonetes bacterium]|nr:sugar transferase [Candidatus Cloacimonadota bacterium]